MTGCCWLIMITFHDYLGSSSTYILFFFFIFCGVVQYVFCLRSVPCSQCCLYIYIVHCKQPLRLFKYGDIVLYSGFDLIWSLDQLLSEYTGTCIGLIILRRYLHTVICEVWPLTQMWKKLTLRHHFTKQGCLGPKKYLDPATLNVL